MKKTIYNSACYLNYFLSWQIGLKRDTQCLKETLGYKGKKAGACHNGAQKIMKITFLLFFLFKVHIFWEGHKILQNLHRKVVLGSNGQI